MPWLFRLLGFSPLTTRMDKLFAVLSELEKDLAKEAPKPRQARLIESLNLLGEEVQENLPHDWSVVITLRKDGADVELLDPDGEYKEVVGWGSGYSDISAACDTAKTLSHDLEPTTKEPPTKEPSVFNPYWPPGIKQAESYRVCCDDKGRNGGSWLEVMVAEDGDVWVSMQDWEEMPEGEPDTFPSIRVRTYAGGGRNARTRQALLWLAEAIRKDNAENTVSQASTKNKGLT